MKTIITEDDIRISDTIYVPKHDNPETEISMEYNIRFLVRDMNVAYDGADPEFWDPETEDIYELAEYLHGMTTDEIGLNTEYDEAGKPHHYRDENHQ